MSELEPFHIFFIILCFIIILLWLIFLVMASALVAAAETVRARTRAEAAIKRRFAVIVHILGAKKPPGLPPTDAGRITARRRNYGIRP